MRRRLRIGLLGAGVALAGVLVPASGASADGTHGQLCNIIDNAYQYESPHGYIERTVHRGHSFRVHDPGGWDGDGHRWVYGHSGESWQDDGWIIAWTSAGHVNLRC